MSETRTRPDKFFIIKHTEKSIVEEQRDGFIIQLMYIELPGIVLET